MSTSHPLNRRDVLGLVASFLPVTGTRGAQWCLWRLFPRETRAQRQRAVHDAYAELHQDISCLRRGGTARHFSGMDGEIEQFLLADADPLIHANTIELGHGILDRLERDPAIYTMSPGEMAWWCLEQAGLEQWRQRLLVEQDANWLAAKEGGVVSIILCCATCRWTSNIEACPHHVQPYPPDRPHPIWGPNERTAKVDALMAFFGT